MSTQPSTERSAQEDAPLTADAEEAREAVEPDAEGDGPQFIDAFGKEAVVSIILFIAFVLFAIICLPTYIF